MPREKINNPRMESGVAWNPDTDEGDQPGAWAERANENPDLKPVYEREAIVQVGWHRSSWVQVSVEGDLSYFRFAAEHPDGETSDRSTVYSPPLTRDEINKLIRVLRRARDQVFGRDE